MAVLDVVLIVFLVISLVTDLLYRKVYNWATFSAVIFGIGLNFLGNGFDGLRNSAAGLALGFALLFVFYLLKGVGAGDIKFLAAVGALKGPWFVLFGGLYGILLGGIAAIIILAGQRRLLDVLRGAIVSSLLFFVTRSGTVFPQPTPRSTFLPYTFFLSAGIILRLIEISL